MSKYVSQSQETNEKPKHGRRESWIKEGKKRIKTLFSRKELYNYLKPKGMLALNRINKTKGFL